MIRRTSIAAAFVASFMFVSSVAAANQSAADAPAREPMTQASAPVSFGTTSKWWLAELAVLFVVVGRAAASRGRVAG
jgi:hypothetical protein